MLLLEGLERNLTALRGEILLQRGEHLLHHLRSLLVDPLLQALVTPGVVLQRLRCLLCYLLCEL